MALGLNNSKIRSDFEDAGCVCVGEGGGVGGGLCLCISFLKTLLTFTYEIKTAKEIHQAVTYALSEYLCCEPPLSKNHY